MLTELKAFRWTPTEDIWQTSMQRQYIHQLLIALTCKHLGSMRITHSKLVIHTKGELPCHCSAERANFAGHLRFCPSNQEICRLITDPDR